MNNRFLHSTAIFTCVAATACSTIAPIEEVKRTPKGTQTEVMTVPAVTSGALPAFPSTSSLATAKSDESPAERQVRARAQERWNALLIGNIDLAYTFFSPASKTALPIDLYKSKTRLGAWKSASVRRVDCVEAARCAVTTGVVMKVASGRVGVLDHESYTNEVWVSTNNEWWLVMQ